MKKRILSGGLALIVISMSISSMFISASAVAPLVAAGAAVCIGQIFAWVLNEMTGGNGYDLSDAISDMIEVTVDWCEGVPEAIGRGVDYTVQGYRIIGDAVNSYFDAMGDAGAALFDFTGTCFDGYKPAEVLTRAMQVINQKIEEGKIFIGYDESGELVMSTKDYCSLIDYIYSDFGVEINGDERTYNTVKLVSDYAQWYSIGPDFYSNVFSYDYLMGSGNNYSVLNLFPVLITSDQVYVLKFWLQNWSSSSGQFRLYNDTIAIGVNNLEMPSDVSYNYSNYGYMSYRHMQSDIFISGSISSSRIFIESTHKDMISNTPLDVSFSDYGGITFYNSDKTYDDVVSSEDVINWGWVGVTSGQSHNYFLPALKKGEGISSDVINKDIPLTGTEDVIKDMGLAGVGSSAKPGTVEVDQEGNVTVTDTKTGAAELVQQYPTVGDIDVPDSEVIFDKFPFSLPFDLYRILTIFVADPKEPIFTFPIKTSFEIEGVEVSVDEEFVADFTQFEIGGLDFVQILVQTGFYILFVAFLIKITPGMIKH